MDDVKKCSKCGILTLKSNLHKKLRSKDELDPRCIPCMNKEYLDNQDKIITQQIEYKNNKYKTDDNFRLICRTRSRIRKALQGKSESSSLKDILGIDINTYKRCIVWQMTPDMTWDNIEIDHVKAFFCLIYLKKKN